MRWLENWKLHKEGDTRIVKRFALLPIYDNNGEWRWLETVWIKQVFECVYMEGCRWYNKKFVDKPEVE